MPNTLLLLDVDGVLNPRKTFSTELQRTVLVLDDCRLEIVRRLASWADIAWASTWSLSVLRGLGDDIGLREQRFATCSPPGSGATPKLEPVSRWLQLQILADEFTWNRIVWIDDSLKGDAHSWATDFAIPVTLIAPDAKVGVTAGDVAEVG